MPLCKWKSLGEGVWVVGYAKLEDFYSEIFQGSEFGPGGGFFEMLIVYAHSCSLISQLLPQCDIRLGISPNFIS